MQTCDRVRRPWSRPRSLDGLVGRALCDAFDRIPIGACTRQEPVQSTLVKADHVGVSGDPRAEKIAIPERAPNAEQVRNHTSASGASLSRSATSPGFK